MIDQVIEPIKAIAKNSFRVNIESPKTEMVACKYERSKRYTNDRLRIESKVSSNLILLKLWTETYCAEERLECSYLTVLEPKSHVAH